MKKLRQIFKYIQSDAYRYCGQCDIAFLFVYYLKDRLFRWHVAFRVLQVARHSIVGRILWRLNSTRHSIQIPPSTQVGYGLYLGHGVGVVVNGSARIGNNCNLSQFVTIGSNDGQAAILGDNVYIGPNTCVVESVRIGSNATIGAGSIVTKDIPDNATAAGNYAKVLNYNNPGRYIRNRWEVSK